MSKDLVFENVCLEVREICDSLGYSCTFNRKNSSFYIYGKSRSSDFPVITNCLFDSVSSLKRVSFCSVGIADGKLRALFFID